MMKLHELYQNGLVNGVPDMRILFKDEVHEMEQISALISVVPYMLVLPAWSHLLNYAPKLLKMQLTMVLHLN